MSCVFRPFVGRQVPHGRRGLVEFHGPHRSGGRQGGSPPAEDPQLTIGRAQPSRHLPPGQYSDQRLFHQGAIASAGSQPFGSPEVSAEHTVAHIHYSALLNVAVRNVHYASILFPNA